MLRHTCNIFLKKIKINIPEVSSLKVWNAKFCIAWTSTICLFIKISRTMLAWHRPKFKETEVDHVCYYTLGSALFYILKLKYKGKRHPYLYNLPVNRH